MRTPGQGAAVPASGSKENCTHFRVYQGDGQRMYLLPAPPGVKRKDQDLWQWARHGPWLPGLRERARAGRQLQIHQT